ncbi:aquaporin-like protein [Trichophaea hybrida]|nr:aquaporin-like protein [Trichophaea hybrida]
MSGKDRSSSSTAPIADESGLSGRRFQLSHNSVVKNYGIAAAGEFLGTFLFFTLAYCATQAAKVAHAQAPDASPIELLIYISLTFAISLTVNVWLFYRVSGGLFNPALTLAFVLLQKMTPAKGALLALSQLLAGIAAAAVAEALLPVPLEVQTGLGKGVSTAQGLFIELVLTAELALTVFMIAVEKHKSTFMAPLVIGSALGVGHLVGISFTGASMNPARSFGPAVVAGKFNGDHWIYWVGPILGAAAAAGIYKLLLVVDYTSANPGQDSDGSVVERGTRGEVFVDATATDGSSRA